MRRLAASACCLSCFWFSTGHGCGSFAKGRAFIVFLLLAVFALLGGADKSRLFVYLLPLVVLLSVVTISSIKPASRYRFLLWAVVFLCGHWYIGNYLTPIGTFNHYLAKLVPEYAAELGHVRHEPFLIRDCLLGILMLPVTVCLMLGEWYFRPEVGFTRRDAVPSEESRGRP